MLVKSSHPPKAPLPILLLIAFVLVMLIIPKIDKELQTAAIEDPIVAPKVLDKDTEQRVTKMESQIADMQDIVFQLQMTYGTSDPVCEALHDPATYKRCDAARRLNRSTYSDR